MQIDHRPSEGAPVQPAAAEALELAAQRYGDRLYRTALLLTSADEQAGDVLLRTMQAAGQAAALDEPALILLLLAALPRERRGCPGWAAQAPADLRPLLAAFARLPRRQKVALALSSIWSCAPAQAAHLLGCDEREARELVADG